MAGLTVDVLGRTTVSAADGTFSIGGVPTARHLLVVHATLQSTTSFLTGSSAPTPPVRGGTTSVGDIVVRSAAFETDLGTLAPDCFNCQLTVTLPFTFPMSGAAIHQVSVDLNGYLVSDGGYINAFCCNLKRDPDDPASGLYVNDQLTDRLVVTWYRERTDYTGDGLNTIQVVLFADGRIQFGYDGIAAGGYPEVDVQTAANLIFREVDFSASSDLIQGPNDGLYESFDPVNRPFDLDGGFVVFEPRLEGGYRIRSVSDAVGPTCSMTSPANGSTVFGGEHIIVETTATHQFPITRVSFRSSDDSLDADALPWTPFSASFIVPLGVSQLTLTATVYDSWNHPAVCTTTVNVVAGPPPAVTILSPAAGTVLTAGSAIAVKVQAISRLPVSRIDGAVNGRAFFSHPIEFSEAVEPPNPQVTEFRFTVPAGAASVTLSGSAVDSVGKTGDSGGVTFSVAADARTALRGRVVDQSDAAVSGARVRAMLHGVSAEIFDFSTALTELPDLTGRTPDRITTVPSLNMRNPDLMFGSDPFGFGASPSRVVRFTSALSLDGGCYCVFTLGVNQGARLIVNGYTILDVAGLSGFQQVRSQPISLRGAGSLQLLTYDNGGLDVQLSFEHTGWGTPAEVVPPGAFVPAIDLWQTTSDSSGAFAIANMPTTLGDLGAIATVVPATGTRSSGRAAAVPPVANGPTDVGTIRLGASPDIFTGDGDFGSVFRIDAITGTVEQVTVGPSLRNPTGLTMLRSGLLAVASSTPLTGGVAIVSVDPRLPSGQNTSVIASGGLLQAPAQIVEEAGGTLVVSDSFGPLIRIDPALPPSGNQSLVSTDLFSSSGLALEADGTIIIGDRYSGVLVRVNPQTGAQTPVPGSSGYPIYVAVESSGSLLLTSNPFFGPVTVYRLAADGTTTSLASGNYVYNPTGMALEPSGDILLMDSFYGLVRVNKDTGAQTLLVPRDVLGSPVGVTLAPR